MLGPAKDQRTVVPSTTVGPFGLYEKSATFTGLTFVTVKGEELVPVPPGDVTLTGPVAAPDGTVAAIEVSDMMVKAAVTPPKLVAVAPEKWVPVIETDVPAAPAVGSRPATVGAGGEITVNEPALVAVPALVLTVMGPEVAPAGTVAATVASSETEKAAACPLNRTEKASVNPLPLIVT